MKLDSTQSHRPQRPPAAAFRICLVVLLAFLLALPAAARGPKSWGKGVQEAEALLIEGEYAAALKITHRILEDMAPTLLAGTSSDRALATVLAIHAVAESGTGDPRAAEWHWFLAVSLQPDLSRTSLAKYGPAGERLDKARLGEEQKAEPKVLLEPGEGGEPLAGGPMDCEEPRPPVKLEAPYPPYPQELREFGIEGKVVIRARLDVDGRLAHPSLVETPAPGLGYLVAETVRQWRFDPAHCDGRPVPTLYNVTVNMEMR